ncbi:MAG: transglycosylase domain-containing protein [Bacteriovoracaceae bacterium]|nr:transglycosylase domain-containing protein [Bacteriovoracaceae bacterium]
MTWIKKTYEKIHHYFNSFNFFRSFRRIPPLWIKIGALSFLAIFLMAFAFIWSTISELGPKQPLTSSIDLPTLESFTWEQDGLIEKSDMEILFPFLEVSSPFESWWSEVIDESIIMPVRDIRYDNKALYQVMAPQNFTFYRMNQCKHSFCYQRRLIFEQIPPNVWRGLMGVEDERFLTHVGVDFWAIFRALWADIKSFSLAQGGSTLTQQIVKNLYLDGEKSITRKLKEIILSLYLETRYSKEEILLTYFNEVYWGSLAGIRINGLFSASVLYFAKRPEHLSDYEMCILVAMLKGPGLYSPLKNPDKLRERADLVFKKLQAENFIAKFENEIWKEADWKKWTSLVSKKNSDYHFRTITQNLRLPYDMAGNFYEQLIFSYHAETVLAALELKKKSNPKTAKLETDFAYKIFTRDLACPVDGNCSKDYFFYSKIERDQSTAYEIEKHQVGSILKPIIYRLYVGLGKDLSDSVNTEAIVLKLKSGSWSPKESIRSTSNLGMQISIKEALQKSRNIPTIRIAEELGMEVVEKLLIDYVPDLMVPLAEYPSQLLGSIELSFSKIAVAYEKYVQDECRDLVDGLRTSSNSTLLAMSDPMATTIGPVIQSKVGTLTFFGKTGTSNKGNDNWFIAFDGRYLTIIWTGNERKEEEKSLEFTGAGSSFRVYEQFLLTRGRRFPSMDCANLLPK